MSRSDSCNSELQLHESYLSALKLSALPIQHQAQAQSDDTMDEGNKLIIVAIAHGFQSFQRYSMLAVHRIRPENGKSW